MRTVVLASVRVHARRYVAALLAVVAGVSFVLVTISISSAAKSGMLASLSSGFRGVDVLVPAVPTDRAAAVVSRLQRLGPVVVNAEAQVPVARGDNQVADSVEIRTVPTDPALRWQRLAAGRMPTGPGEALLDADQAGQSRLAIGDRLRIGEDTRDGGTAEVRVVGLARGSLGPLSAAVYVPWPDLQRLGGSVFVDSVGVGGASVDQVSTALRTLGTPRGAAELEAVPTTDYLQEQAASQTRDVDAVAALLLVFAAIALFVSVLVIANTFTVLLAQRQREFALLRCVGASRRQVLRSVRVEALALGVVAATLGVGVGLLLGRLVVLAVDRFLPAVPAGSVRVGLGWVATAWTVGVLVTLVASWFPARRTTRVEPLAALRPLGAVEVRTRAGAGRVAIGIALAVLGAVVMVLAPSLGGLLVALAGGFVSFVGMLVLGPLVVPAAVRLVGRLTGRWLGVPGRLAAANAVRNPRRTAATAASLLVGTTLLTGLVVGTSTIRHSVAREMDLDHPLDAALVSSRALPDGVLARVREVDGVDRAVGLRGADVEVIGRGYDATTGEPTRGLTSLGSETVLAVPSGAGDVVRGEAGFAHPGPGTAYLPWRVMNELGDQSRITLTRGGRSLTVHPIGVIGIDAVLVAPATLTRLAPEAGLRAAWVRGEDGLDADAVTARLGAIARAGDAGFSQSLQDRAYVDFQLDVLVYAVLALLSVALLIALLGIANTLGLSVLERGREHALLRALGLTRGQLRLTLAVEAVLLAVVTSVIGVVIGSAYALATVRTAVLAALGDTGVQLSLPVGQLLLVVLVAVVAGLGACVLPARRAARTAPAAGLALE